MASPTVADSTNAVWVLKNAGDAISRALGYTGFGEFKITSTEERFISELVTINDDKTPFLHSLINGHIIWKVVFTGVNLRERKIDTAENCIDCRNFEVYLDPETGQLLKIISKSEEVDTNIAPEPQIERAERQLLESGERWTGFVNATTSCTFLQALLNCPYKGFSENQIEAVLVMYLNNLPGGNKAAEPVWIITVRGISPIPSHGPRHAADVPVYQRNYVHEYVDASNCRLLSWKNVPTVEPRE
jgi:hypothetical protein